MKPPKLSIIIPSLNQGQYLGKAIESILEQQYPAVELLIIDGDSSDDTVEVIKRYDRHIAYWVSEADNGQSDAINKGLAQATGEIINWLNSDDYYCPGALGAIAKAFTAKDALCVCGVTRVFGNGQDRTKHSYVNPESLKDTLCNLLIEQPATFFRKEIFDKFGGVAVDLSYVMDRDLWLRFLGTYGLDRIVSVNETLVNFRHHENSKTVSQGDAFVPEYAALLYHFCQNSELRDLLRQASGDQFERIHLEGRENVLGTEIVNVMVVSFLIKYARNLSRIGKPELSREVLNRIDFSIYGLGKKEWKWLWQLSLASEGYVFGMIKYIGRRYFR